MDRWPLTNVGMRDLDPLCNLKCEPNLWSTLWICGSGSAGSTDLGLCSTAAFTLEKNPRTSGPTELKPGLFQGPLYISEFTWNCWFCPFHSAGKQRWPRKWIPFSLWLSVRSEHKGKWWKCPREGAETERWGVHAVVLELGGLIYKQTKICKDKMPVIQDTQSQKSLIPLSTVMEQPEDTSAHCSSSITAPRTVRREYIRLKLQNSPWVHTHCFGTRKDLVSMDGMNCLWRRRNLENPRAKLEEQQSGRQSGGGAEDPALGGEGARVLQMPCSLSPEEIHKALRLASNPSWTRRRQGCFHSIHCLGGFCCCCVCVFSFF